MIGLSVLTTVRRRAQRVRKMSLREMAGRARMEASKWADRVAPGRWTTEPAGLFAERAAALLEPNGPTTLIRERLPRRGFAGIETRMGAAILSERLPHSHDDILRAADGILAHRFSLLGYKNLQLGATIDWHRDIVHGVRAAQTHWTAIEPLNPRTVGDSKVTWELNRHQWLVTLAEAYWLTGDTRYATAGAELVRDWTRANPYGVGINWSSSLEASYRLIAWCWAIPMLRESSAWTNSDWAALLSQIWLHAMHVERYLSYYFSPNTHLTGEALGLFYAGVLFPEFADAPRWRDLGQRILVDESRRQILEDGVYFEQATCYQRYTIEIYLHFLILAERNQVALPPDVARRVERMLDVLLTVSHPDRTTPPIGDADGGRLMPLTPRQPGDCRDVFGLGAVMFERPDFAAAADGLQPEVICVFGESGVARFDRLQPAAPTLPASQCLKAGGYAVMRSGWEPTAHQMLVDVGPLGCPHASAHGHADLLSVQVDAFGERYLVDPGTYGYTAAPVWRDHFRGSAAHNTVVIDGQGQVEPRGPFAWQGRPCAVVRDWRSNSDYDLVDAEHRAYERLEDPVTHRRRVLFVKPDFWIVVDDLDGRSTHDVELRFQFAPRVVTPGPQTWVSSEGRNGTGLWLASFSTTPLTTSIRRGQTDPIEGWISSDYGQREPAPLVVYATTGELPLRIVTLVLPVRALQPQPPAVELIDGKDGAIGGVRLVETGETILIDRQEITVRRGDRTIGGR